MFAERFHWTPAQVDDLPWQVAEDLMLIVRYQAQLAPKAEVPGG